MFFKLVKYALVLEVTVIMFLSLVNENSQPELITQVNAFEVEMTIPTPRIINLVPSPEPNHTFTPEDTLKAIADASILAKCIIRNEVGGGTKKYARWDPYSVGAAGELGAAQLHPRGKLVEFYRLGYTNPFNPYQSIEYLEDALKRGQKYHWTSVGKGVCK